uniref:Decaprenyl-phosphate phosphoribosyltransferase n=1 Tax=candidate division WOR-3 bacterium TaxID=2052148 RepID=A0A7C3YT31_UNCW3
MVRELIKSLRPRQWTKNAFVFAGLFFSQNLFHLSYLYKSLAAFFLFSFLSGATYIINDIKDINEDRIHPKKRFRPIASGRLKVSIALPFALLLILLSLILGYCLNRDFFLVLLLYLILTLAYSFFLKEIVILDLLTIAFGFVLRALGGTVVIGVSLSVWLFICTILLALFLGITKRKTEIALLGDSAPNHRSVLFHYSHNFLDQMTSVVTAATVVSYSIYTVAPETVAKFGTNKLFLTIPFVLYGIFRYLYLIYHAEFLENPEWALIKDIPLTIAVLLWAISVGLILYLRWS